MLQQRDDASRRHANRRDASHRRNGWLFSLTAVCCLALCSCTQTGTPSVASVNLLERAAPQDSAATSDSQSLAQASIASIAATADGTPSDSITTPATPREPLTQASPSPVVQQSGAIRHVAHTVPAETDAEHGALSQTVSRSRRIRRSVEDCPTVFTPCEPRCPAPYCPTPGYVPAPWELGPGSSPVPAVMRDGSDEYICDGGDRELPVHYNGLLRMGLETEDTVAEYTDDEGQYHVRESTRVCIYAPRFGAVRTLSTPLEDYAVDRLGSARKLTYSTGLRNRVAVRDHTQRTQLDGVRVRSRVSGLETEVTHSGVDHAASAAQHELLQNVFQNLAFVSRGELDQRDRAFLSLGIQSAVTWTRDLYPKIIAVDAGASEVVSVFEAEEFVGVEDEKEIGRLRIVKLADRKTAKPGDIVTFTLRYDNLGDRELREIRIVDNLTPRLAFIPDSVTSDREGELSLEDNGEGSHVLTFSLKEPLPGHTGGVITFQTRVR